MPGEVQSLKELFTEAEAQRDSLDSYLDSNSVDFQTKLLSTISKYEQCLSKVSEVSLFSVNESLEDVSSTDLRYLSINYQLAELIIRIANSNRRSDLEKSRREYENFLRLLDNYDILSKDDVATHERYHDDPRSFSTASVNDAALRRQQKIARFKKEKILKEELKRLETTPYTLGNDESILRESSLIHIQLRISMTFQGLEAIAQELQVIAMAPPSPPPERDPQIQDLRERERERANPGGYSDRLDGHSSRSSAFGKSGPILSSKGRPLRPFTLLDTRQRMQQAVFRPDHNLPTMTIDEYLEEEKRRGGIIEGGGEQSMKTESFDEDDMNKADEETTKARKWDEFTEDNPRGSGNTMNMG